MHTYAHKGDIACADLPKQQTVQVGCNEQFCTDWSTSTDLPFLTPPLHSKKR